jgi:hypothetical protein
MSEVLVLEFEGFARNVIISSARTTPTLGRGRRLSVRAGPVADDPLGDIPIATAQVRECKARPRRRTNRTDSCIGKAPG